MKYWCYYANVVRYLEKVEALLAPITRGPAYLVWTDDDGPHMIAGPGIHWYRGDGPMPDLDSLEIPVSINAREGSASAQSTPKKKLRAARVSKRSPANAQSTRPARQCRAATWRKPPACRVEPPAHHNREMSVKPGTHPPKKAYNFSETRSNLLTKETEPRTEDPSVIRGAISQLPQTHQAKNDALPTRQPIQPKAAQPRHKQYQSNTPRRASK